MSILDELLEKKDLVIYINERTTQLQREMDKAIFNLPRMKRNGVRMRFKGRLFELKQLLTLIEQGKLKQASKTAWRKNRSPSMRTFRVKEVKE